MNEQLSAIVAYFQRLLAEKRVTRELIIKTVQEDSFAASLSKEEKLQITKHLEFSFVIEQNRGSVISSDREPWLNEKKSQIEFFYWNRLKRYLLGRDLLPRNVISILDTDTDDILDLCGDPTDEDNDWSIRGMVMGHVQSGKTTNYAALINKAADTGYRVIILLAGITNSLRTQTQERIDEYFIGRKSVFNAAAQDPLPIINYGEGVRRDPDFGTTRESDFNRNNAVAGAAIASLKEPKIFILKKNKSVLENLNTWLNDQAHGNTIKFPLLLIDDEADNASINTSQDPERSTMINNLIRELLGKFSRSTYIGYTATPFANIFIEPETNSAMEHEDLFPRHFIKALDAPNNYCGAQRTFSEEGDLKEKMLVQVSDYVDILPIKHKKDLALDTIPPSLYESIRTYVLARAIRYIRGHGSSHCTMMINVSRFNDMQAQVNGLVYEYLEQLRSSITTSARARNPLADHNIKSLSLTFSKEYSGSGTSFDEILKILHQSSSTIRVITVNMRGGILDYDNHKKTGLHVIAIGGLALSRGLTLEGLITTYILRNVGASDTLMQMARWFGYRRDYEDLCRLYLPEESQKHYEQITLAIEELHSEVKYMQASGQTPYDFGLKVRESETGIRITAGNKMRTATSLLLASSFSARYVQGHTIFNDQKKNLAHIKSVREFLLQYIEGKAPKSNNPFYWEGISGLGVHKLLTQFNFPTKVYGLSHINSNTSLVSDYIKDRVSNELSGWDVALVTRKYKAKELREVNDLLSGETLNPIRRTSAFVDKGNYRFTKKDAVGDRDTLTLGLNEEQKMRAKEYQKVKGDKSNRYCLVREKPLLVIFLIGLNQNATAVDIEDYCVSLALSLPKSSKPAKEHLYQVNAVFKRTMLMAEEEDEDEDSYKLVDRGE